MFDAPREMLVCLSDGREMLHAYDRAVMQCPKCKLEVRYDDVKMSARCAIVDRKDFRNVG